ncbi:MAG: MAPEG family protein [Caulobacteraceae bacterium]
MDTVVTPAAHAAAFWVSLHLFLLLILAVRVVRQRQAHKVLIGDEGVPALLQARRAFGNATEYAPAGMGALCMLALVGAPSPVLHAMGATLFVGRLAHGVGLSLSAGPSIGRTAGTLMTWLAFLFAAVLLLVYAF